jgi:cell division protein FtsN
MYTFLFDKKSLVLLLTGMTVAGGLLFFGGVLVGVQWGLPFETSPVVSPVVRPAPAPRQAALPATPADVPCKPEPAAIPMPAAPELSPAPGPEPRTFASAATTVPVPQEPAPPTAPVAETRIEEPEPVPEPEPAVVTASQGRYSLQIGAFKRAENSEKVIQALQSKGYEPYVIEQRGRSILKTVRIGRYADRGEALKAAADFRRREGMTAIVRPIDS